MNIYDIIKDNVNTLYPITLNEVLSKLKGCQHDKHVLFAYKGQNHTINYMPVNAFCSWRGSYSEPTCYSEDDTKYTVEQLIRVVENFIGSTQDGWKGGEFTMQGNSGLWADRRGVSEQKGVIDVVECDDCVAFVVAQCTY